MAAVTRTEAVRGTDLIEWAVAHRTRPGDVESGDLHVVEPFATGVLLAAIDGLGHGEQAAATAGIAAAILREHAPEPVEALLERCHRALARTRGVVMSLASLSAREPTMTWLGVGNVEGVVARSNGAAMPAQPVLLLRAGVVGQQLPALQPETLPIRPGDMVLLATDGIRPDFAHDLQSKLSPQRLAERILARSGKDTDDALVLVARLRGGTA